MLCKVCGRTATNEAANFCEYCGASFREGTMNGFPDFSYNNTQSNQVTESYNKVVTTDSIDKPMSFGNWMTVLILPFVPVIGSFVYIGLLFVWAFGKKATETKKNWARATLVILVLAFIMLMVYFGSGVNFLEGFGII